MKTLKIIGIIILIVAVLFVLISYLLPRHITVERSATIPAPVELVFDQVNILKNWELWSPWHQIDPNMILEYTGPEAGKGAMYSWASNHQNVGNGTFRITESVPYSLIKAEMNFMEQGTAYAKYTFLATDEGTRVTWSMESDMGNNPIGRYLGLFMDKWLGNDFEKGLKNIQELVLRLPVKEGIENQPEE